MIVKLNRHGARTPNHEFKEIEEIFPDYQKGVLIFNCWREQFLLGENFRNKYLYSNKHGLRSEPYLKITNPSKQYLIISLPLSRVLESAIAFSSGLFPDYFYKIINQGGVTENNKDNQISPIINHYSKTNLNDTHSYNLMVTDMKRDILFKGKKCKFHKEKSEKKEIPLITDDEKIVIYDYLKETFPITMKHVELENLNSTLIKQLHTAIICVNANYKVDPIKMSKKVREIFSKWWVNYNYLIRFKDKDQNKLMSSQFFDMIIKMFDSKTGNGERKLHFLNNTQIEYDDLRLAVFSGHDGNILASLNILIKEEILNSLLKNPIDNYNYLIPKFSSSLEFHLIKKANIYYVKVIYNGLDITDEIQDSNGKEIEYQKFKNLLISKIYPDYQNCDYKS